MNLWSANWAWNDNGTSTWSREACISHYIPGYHPLKHASHPLFFFFLDSWKHLFHYVEKLVSYVMFAPVHFQIQVLPFPLHSVSSCQKRHEDRHNFLTSNWWPGVSIPGLKRYVSGTKGSGSAGIFSGGGDRTDFSDFVGPPSSTRLAELIRVYKCYLVPRQVIFMS